MISVSIIIPVYNEERTILTILEKIKDKINELKHDIDFELIIVDDHSSDKTKEILKENKHLYNLLLENSKNKGKGFSVNQGIQSASKEVILIQDADLEYLPENYENLIKPFINSNADVVYGSRFRTTEVNRVIFFWHYIANKLITFTSNCFSNLNLSDVEVGYKLFRKNLLDNIVLTENSFGFEIEITHKLASLKKKVKIFEVGISYYARDYSEGKKIGAKDALRAIYCILKFGIFKR